MTEEIKGDRCPTCNGGKTTIAKTDAGLGIEVACTECKGVGLVNSPNACTICIGTGTVQANLGGLSVEVACEHCNSSGLEPQKK